MASRYLGEVRAAFAAWAAVINVDFREVADGADNDIRIGMGNLGGTGGVLGRTDRWSSGSTITEAAIAMDSWEYWTPTHFYNVVLHEIGHALGLAHSGVRDAVMYAGYRFSGTTPRLRLHQDDIDGAKTIFAPSDPNLAPPSPGTHSSRFTFLGDLATTAPASGAGAVVRTGTVVRTAQSFQDNRFGFLLGASRTVRIELRGLTADADLYLRGPSGTVVARSVRGATAVDTIDSTLAAGFYTIRVNPYAAGTIDYQLRVSASLPPADGRTRETAFDLGDLTALTFPRLPPADTVNRDDNDHDYRRFTLTASHTIRIELRDLTADANLYLEDSSGRVLADSTLGGTADDTIVRTLGAGTYYVRVDAHAAGDIGYRLRVRRESGPPADGRTRQTAFDLGDLTTLASPRTFSDTVDRDGNDHDYRRFTLTARRTMRFVLHGLSADADLFLESSTGTVLARSIHLDTAVDTIVRTLDAGTYYVRVDAWSSGTIGYRLRFSGGSPLADGRTRQTAHELGDLTTLASPLAFSGTVERDSGNDDDYRRFTLTAGRTMRFELRGLTADANLYLEDSSGRVLERAYRHGTADDTIVRTLDAGTYYVRVDAFSAGTIGYRLRVVQVDGSPAAGWTRQTAVDLGDLTTLASPRTFSGTVNWEAGNDDDYRRFTLTAGRTMRFELRGLSADADLLLENSAGQVIGGARPLRRGTLDETFVRTLDAGTYYVRVWARDGLGHGGAIDYQLRLGQAADGLTRESAYELGDLTALASPLTFSDTVDRDGNDDDYRRFTLTARRTMRFELHGLSADADLYLESATGTVLERAARRSPPDDTIVRTLEAGTYYVRVDAFGSGTIDYQLRLSQVSPLTPRTGGDTRQTAHALGDLTGFASPLTFVDTVNRDGNDNDYRRFTLTARRTMRFELSGLTADANLFLEGATGAVLARSERGSTRDDTIVRTLDAGTYYVRVDAVAPSTIGYRLRIDQESGTTRHTAADLGDLTTALASPRTFSGTVNRDSDDEDYRRFTLTARRTMRFELRGLSADADLFLESSDGTLLSSSAHGFTSVDRIVRTLEAGTYYVRVDAHAPGTITYQLRLSQDGSPPAAAGRTRQTAHALGDLTSLASPRTFSGTVNRDGNDDDYRRFTLTARRTMRFELSGLSADADLYLESSTGAVITQSARGSTLGDTIVRTLEAGTYYVRVDAFAPGTITYQLRLSQQGSPSDPPSGGRTRQAAFDLGDLTSLASPLTFSDTVNRDGNDDDYRRFTLTARRTMRFELHGLTADADLYLESSTGTVVARSTRGTTLNDAIVRTLDAGTYYVRVDAFAPGTISYRLRIDQGERSGPTRQTAFDLGDLTTLASPRAFSGTVNRNGNDDDYRRFTLTARRTMRFELRGLSADADLYLESSTGTVLARSARGLTLGDTIVRTLEAGTYYVRVDAFSSGTIQYQLRFSQQSVPSSPPPAEGQTRQTAFDLGNLTTLASPRTFSDTVDRNGNDHDYRRFTLTARRTMRFELRGLSADADLYLESSTGTVLARSTRGSTLSDTIVRTLDAGTYYVRVDAFAPGTIDYRLRLSQESSPQTGGQTRSTAFDLGDLTTLASPRTFSDTVNRNVNYQDYRRFTLTARRTMRFELHGLAADADLFLESPNGRTLARSTRGGTADDTIVRTLDAGTYYVRVAAFGSGTIGYQLRFSQPQAADSANLVAAPSQRLWRDGGDAAPGRNPLANGGSRLRETSGILAT